MKKLRIIELFVGMTILIAAFGSSAKADEFNELTILTFSSPVEIPGHAVLPAGTYVFKLLPILGDRNIVQIFNRQQTKVYATVFTIPAQRLQPTDKSVVGFYEGYGGGRNALKVWFYPGHSFGHAFVYPKSRAAALTRTARDLTPLDLDPSSGQPR
jgi:hypothetical protein